MNAAPDSDLGDDIGDTKSKGGTHGTDQDIVQRMLTAKTVAKSRLALILSGLADLPIVLCFLTIGILLWAFIRNKRCPIRSHITSCMKCRRACVV